jgi:hypothetical protein
VPEVPWACGTCGKTYLGEAPPSFLWRVQEEIAELAMQVRTLEEEMVRCTHAIRALEERQAVLNQYLTLIEEQENTP